MSILRYVGMLTCGRNGAFPRPEILEELVVLATQGAQRLAVFEQQLGKLLFGYKTRKHSDIAERWGSIRTSHQITRLGMKKTGQRKEKCDKIVAVPTTLRRISSEVIYLQQWCYRAGRCTKCNRESQAEFRE